MRNVRPNNDNNNDLRVNKEIRAREVRVIDQNGEMLGVMSTYDAIGKAYDAKMDLIEVSPNAEPPVCKIGDYGKLKYQKQKKANISKKKQKTVDIKEVKMTVNIGRGDFETKLKNAVKFLEKENKVKFSIRFKGREITHPELVDEMLTEIIETTKEIAKVELAPKMEGRQKVLILAPNK